MSMALVAAKNAMKAYPPILMSGLLSGDRALILLTVQGVVAKAIQAEQERAAKVADYYSPEAAALIREDQP
jgi:hypothetical protein